MLEEISKNGGPTTSDAGDDTLSRQQLIKEGFQEKEHFWYKRNKHGSVQISKNEKSDPTTLTEEGQLMDNKNVKQAEKEEEVGRFTVLEYDRSKLFDEKGALILMGVKK